MSALVIWGLTHTHVAMGATHSALVTHSKNQHESIGSTLVLLLSPWLTGVTLGVAGGIYPLDIPVVTASTVL
jgi:hypothetical protein